MDKAIAAQNKKRLKDLQAQLKKLQADLVIAHKLEGKDPNIVVKVTKNQGRYQPNKNKEAEDAGVGKFFIEVAIEATQADVYVPLSVASGKKTAGFMYQIEGTAQASIISTSTKVRGEGVSQVTLGTLHFVKIPVGTTATIQIQAMIRGKSGKKYKLVFTRINYKLNLADARYEQYLRQIHSDTVTFSG